MPKNKTTGMQQTSLLNLVLQPLSRFGAICSFGFGFIIKHDLADRAWVRQWVTFRKEQAVERAQLFEKLEETTF